MRLLRVGLWSSLGLPLIAGCVSAPGGYAAYRQAPRMELALAALENGGPGAQVRVTTVRRPGQVPMIEPSFSIADDGYVLVGTLGSNGSVRVIFPTEPTDDGRVEGGRSYRLPPVVPGEAYDLGGDLSRARSRTGELWNTGYVFIIASYEPMRFDRIAEEREWAVFDAAYEGYHRDPRPAVVDLARALVDDVDDVTLKWASYTLSSRAIAGLGGSGSRMCAYGSTDPRLWFDATIAGGWYEDFRYQPGTPLYNIARDADWNRVVLTSYGTLRYDRLNQCYYRSNAAPRRVASGFRRSGERPVVPATPVEPTDEPVKPRPRSPLDSAIFDTPRYPPQPPPRIDTLGATQRVIPAPLSEVRERAPSNWFAKQPSMRSTRAPAAVEKAYRDRGLIVDRNGPVLPRSRTIPGRTSTGSATKSRTSSGGASGPVTERSTGGTAGSPATTSTTKEAGARSEGVMKAVGKGETKPPQQ